MIDQAKSIINWFGTARTSLTVNRYTKNKYIGSFARTNGGLIIMCSSSDKNVLCIEVLTLLRNSFNLKLIECSQFLAVKQIT